MRRTSRDSHVMVKTSAKNFKMASSKRKFMLLATLITSVTNISASNDCIVGNFNLTRLSTFNPWTAVDEKGQLQYEINLCGTSSPSNQTTCKNGITVSGLNTTSGETMTFGSCGQHNSTEEEQQSELFVIIQGSTCSVLPGELSTTMIYFKCGKTMGSPVCLDNFGCTVYFEWESTEFCKDLDPAVSEIPCYVINGTSLIDLSPLTKLRGGYLVDDQNNHKFYINVCRDISPDVAGGTDACPKGSASCRMIDGTGADMGHPTNRLQITSEGDIKMIYTSPQKPNGCIENPITSVSFKCPERGGSREPMLIGDFLCSIEIEWFTEYACPRQMLSSTSCQLTMNTHNIDIDLHPLHRPQAYEVPGKSGADNYIYKIRVCGAVGVDCGHSAGDTAICQEKPGNDEFHKRLGLADHQILRYSDGELSLIYKDGDPCRTHFRRKTVITFHCQKDAEHDGLGQPVFREDNNCTYFFDWNTKYACLDRPAETACRVEHEGQRFDLSNLIDETGSNWVATSNGVGREDHQYFVNVCHDVLTEGEAQRCPTGSAVCEIGPSHALNLGSYTRGPVYDPGTKGIYINYTGGAVPDSGCSSVYSTIFFICKPGELESAPELVIVSTDYCFRQFEWHTAVACPLSHQQGSDCKVVDKQAGYRFDLSVLSKAEGYRVSAGEFDYYINICGKLSGDHCQEAPHTNAAVCQVKRGGSSSDDRKAGEPNGNLIYYDGVLNLTYTNGDPYNDDLQTPRKTEIAFVCDPEAGLGSPQFVHERQYTYNFKWLTAYACPTQPVECVAVDDSGKEYDLSSLSKSIEEENWVVLDDSDPAVCYKFYLNICRPLNPVHGMTGKGCDTFAAACETTLSGQEERVSQKNLGQAKSRPTVEKERAGYVRLVYSEGDLCPAGGEGDRFNTTIHFICVKEEQSRGPSPPRKVGPCSYEVLWDTEAACDLSNEATSETEIKATEPCSITDPNTNFTFNLQTLRKPGDGSDFYTVQFIDMDKTRTFRLNICGPVGVPSCGKLMNRTSSVCEVFANLTVPLVYGDHMEFAFTEENNIILTYIGQKDGDQQTKVRIELDCDREADDQKKPIFIHREGDDYLFRLPTPLSCPAQPVDCVVQDSMGKQYDLNSLSKMAGNWEVQDSRPSHSNLRYHINVCRPINQVAASTCPGGPIGGCQTGGQQSYGLGYIQSKPQVADDGAITLRYVGGTICHHGTPNEVHRSMRIIFYCAAKERAPVFIGESASCEYSFSWSTPSACPQQRAVGSDCKVVDPLYNYQFDLTPLHKSDINYEVPDSEHGYKFLLNVCGALHSPPAECQNMGACREGGAISNSVPTGKPNSTLIYDAGELTLTYQEGQSNCRSTYTRKTVLTFRCSQARIEEGPIYLQELDDCTFTFDWPTKLACPPHTVVDCSYTDDRGNIYDLSSLAHTDSNYMETKADGTKIVLNICRSLVHKKGETCPFDSAACLINMTAVDPQKKYLSLGQVSDNPVSMEEGKLVIRYKLGASCSSGGSMSALIVFSCSISQEASQEGGPRGNFVSNNCEYVFLWETSAACPVKPQQLGQDCNVTNPYTGYEFSLKSLDQKDGWEVNDREGHLFRINVCNPVSGTACSNPKVGSCQSEVNGEGRSFSAGIASTELKYQRNGMLLLNYSGGDVCHHNNVSRTTIISFICQPGAGQGRPVFVANSDGCVYYFDWHTNLACEQQVSCEVEGEDGILDLTPLIKQSGHYLAIPDEAAPAKGSNISTAGTYYINVCHPLNPVLGTLCPPGASACRVQEGKIPQGLGQAQSPPVYYVERKEVVLSYDNGWPCEWNPSQNTSSRIVFHCKPGPEEGTPQLIEVSESCEYIFKWETNVICPNDYVEAENSSCTYYDARTKAAYDLSSLREVYEVDNLQGGKFSVQACGALSGGVSSECQGAAVCLLGSSGIHDGSYGKAATGVFEMQGELLKLTFTGGQDCQRGGGTASANIFFDCDYSAGKGQPSMESLECEVTFYWKTSLICPPLVKDCAFTAGDTTYDLTILSQGKQSWEYKTADGSQYWLNLCQAVHGSAFKNQCSPQAAVCRRSKDGRVDMLGDVQSQKMYTEKSTDGNPVVVVEYSQGSPACSSNRRRSNNQVAKSIIHLICGNTVGSPVLANKRENTQECVFEFEWKTRTVCQKDSLPTELKDINHVIQDPRSGGSIDLRPLLTGGNHKAQAGDDYFAISLEGHLSLPNGMCNGATVCHLKHNNTSFTHTLGVYSAHKYYLQEDKLEVVYNSPEKCMGRFHYKNVSSIITFTCNQDTDQRSDPTFLYNTLDCIYLFSWETSAACIQAKIEVQTESSGSGEEGSVESTSGTKSSIKKSTLTAVVSTFTVVIVLCVLAVIFHRPERRAAAATRLKRLIPCRRRIESQMKYSVLSQMEDPEVDLPGSNPFEEDDAEEEKELQNGDTVMVKSYHDDSDDDMLL